MGKPGNLKASLAFAAWRALQERLVAVAPKQVELHGWLGRRPR